MSEQIMALVEKSSLKPEISPFEVGDTVDVTAEFSKARRNAFRFSTAW